MKLSSSVILTAVCFSGFALAQTPANSPGTIVPNRAPLRPNAYNQLPLGSIEPQGWLRQQLQIQADGLTGHLDEFWKDVDGTSGWLGGAGESWERGPYFLDGLLPLAYELKSPTLIAKSKKWVDWTLTHQQASGQIGPTKNDDWWPRMVMLKVLTQYQEVTGDPRVVPLMSKYFAFELRELPNRPLRDWGKYRWHDNVYTVLWLYNRTGEQDLLKLARLLHEQGYDWQKQFADFKYTKKQTAAELELGKKKGEIPERAMQTHGVNNAMALKAAPVWGLITGSDEERKAFYQQIDQLDKYHGLPNGMFSGDEHFAGTDPSQGIELCAVVEAMFSYEDAFSIYGDPRLADRLERITFNALPATLSDDMWSHQYDQQPNQIACTRAKREWSTNGNDSNLFGLEPNFGCCTANLHQGWPKFASSLWMETADHGLLAAAYAPSKVTTKINGTEISVTEQTDYPFHQGLRFTVHTAKPVEFPLQLRIPGWLTSGVVVVDGQTTKLKGSGCVLGDGLPNKRTQCNTEQAFHTIRRSWKDGDVIQVSFDMMPRVSHWTRNSNVFERGPLLFALPLDANWSKLKSYAQKSADWQLETTKPWNYGVQAGECQDAITEQPVSASIFDAKSPAVTMTVQGRQLPQWKPEHNSAGPVPMSPAKSKSEVETLRLVPYGAAKLRTTTFPSLGEKAKCGS